MARIYINSKQQFDIPMHTTVMHLKVFLEQIGLLSEQYYLIANGKRLDDFCAIPDYRIDVIPKVLGGKGGFGSMLRAIGAQIEKTTNREACRDLSGRRLRDINEEQRLKKWINQQAEREKEAKDKRQKKLERLCEKPRHEFRDEEYDKERSALPEKVEDAVLQGLQASCSTKRKATDGKDVLKKKKRKLWVDDELDDLSSSEDDTKESSSNKSNNPKISTNNSSSEDSNSSDTLTTEQSLNMGIKEICNLESKDFKSSSENKKICNLESKDVKSSAENKEICNLESKDSKSTAEHKEICNLESKDIKSSAENNEICNLESKDVKSAEKKELRNLESKDIKSSAENP